MPDNAPKGEHWQSDGKGSYILAKGDAPDQPLVRVGDELAYANPQPTSTQVDPPTNLEATQGQAPVVKARHLRAHASHHGLKATPHERPDDKVVISGKNRYTRVHTADGTAADLAKMPSADEAFYNASHKPGVKDVNGVELTYAAHQVPTTFGEHNQSATEIAASNGKAGQLRREQSKTTVNNDSQPRNSGGGDVSPPLDANQQPLLIKAKDVRIQKKHGLGGFQAGPPPLV